ncbi:hypothetical protein TrRE_jg2978 [Triparma retinervis]|uniref:Uncharacterized protein n=1 Tax=Triparma retinervis TaxID=2557542 RepID=A0A9W7FZ01_9STRA|nr:hypothetical protein TrRE_jg2978 [Triparma retinervis]
MSEGYPSPLPSPPTDGISSLSFSHFSTPAQTNVLLASSWDGTVRQYAPESDGKYCPRASQSAGGSPVLCSAYGVSTRYVYAGCLDGALQEVDMEKGGSTTIGNHEKAVSSVCCMSSPESPWSSSLSGCIASGSWDGNVKLWDVRQPQNCKSASEVSLGAKVFGMDWVDHTLMVCTSGRKVHIFDVRKAGDLDSFTISETSQRESSLKYQTRSCALFPDLDGYAIGSIEGR